VLSPGVRAASLRCCGKFGDHVPRVGVGCKRLG
jgi:hypothetical protein